ncbi:MAG: VUT family protein, partial [Burkholderiaceae bacterium]
VVMNVGLTCVPDGPCLIPVWPGLMAPSGVLLAGLALVLRDAVHSWLGAGWSIVAIAVGAVLSAWLSPPALVLASATAFLFSELADLAVYAPLRKRFPGMAVIASGLAGSVVDSLLFLTIAFGSLQYLPGQVLGKFWMSLIAGAIIAALARRRAAVA